MNRKERLASEALAVKQLEELGSGNKPRSHDRSAIFKIVGGNEHDTIIRIFLPLHDITFPSGDVYQPHPPIGGRSKAWVYIKKEKT